MMMLRSSRKMLGALLAGLLTITACTPLDPVEPLNEAVEHLIPEVTATSLGDPSLLRDVEEAVEVSLVDGDVLLGEEIYIENVEAIYYSKEYLEEVAYNSQANIYFGYTLTELETQFEGEKYVFAPDDEGKTVARLFDEYDSTFEQIIQNVAIGSGVILVLVTASVVAPVVGAPAAFSVIVAASAKGATIGAGIDVALSGVLSGAMTAIQTGDLDSSLRAGGVAASEGFAWGAIGGSLFGGLASLSALRGATRGGVTLSEAARGQSGGLPLVTIKRMRSGAEISIYEGAGLKGRCVFRGKSDLLRKIDLNHKGPNGLTNLERMKAGNAPLDPKTGLPYELHHIGQSADSPLAILTKQEHVGGGNDKILHPNTTASEINRSTWAKERADFWKEFAFQVGAGLLNKCLA